MRAECGSCSARLTRYSPTHSSLRQRLRAVAVEAQVVFRLDQHLGVLRLVREVLEARVAVPRPAERGRQAAVGRGLEVGRDGDAVLQLPDVARVLVALLADGRVPGLGAAAASSGSSETALGTRPAGCGGNDALPMPIDGRDHCDRSGPLDDLWYTQSAPTVEPQRDWMVSTSQGAIL